MIRDPSDGTLREVVDQKPQSLSTRAAKLNADKELLSSTTSGIRQPTKTDAMQRLEFSRGWLKTYHAKKETEHARGSNGEEHQANGDSGNDQGQAEPSVSDLDWADSGAHRES